MSFSSNCRSSMLATRRGGLGLIYIKLIGALCIATRKSDRKEQTGPKWVKRRSPGVQPGSRLCLQERTSSDRADWSVSCHNRT